MGECKVLLKTLDMCEVLLFICILRERDGDMFSSNPFVEVVLNLELEYMSRYYGPLRGNKI